MPFAQCEICPQVGTTAEKLALRGHRERFSIAERGSLHPPHRTFTQLVHLNLNKYRCAPAALSTKPAIPCIPSAPRPVWPDLKLLHRFAISDVVARVCILAARWPRWANPRSASVSQHGDWTVQLSFYHSVCVPNHLCRAL